MSKKLHRKRC